MALRLIFAVLVVTTAGATFATVTPHVLFSDGAVLQQGMTVPVWGTADDGEKVTVEFQNQAVSAVTKGGKWMVRLQPLKAGGPFEMTISGTNTVQLHNILVGEVWVCSGQSNMQIGVGETANAPQAIAASKDPLMRLYQVERPEWTGALPELDDTWKACEPGSVRGFSGIGYFFGRDVRKALGVPVGLIDSSFGGTNVAVWMDAKSVEAATAQKTTDNGRLYDGMIRQLQPYAIRGVIWYQGESDADNSLMYRKLFPAMIRGWRETWGEGDFPFLFVQLTAFNFYKAEVSTAPQEQTTWAETREVQSLTSTTVPNTAIVITTDVGDPKSVHPTRKEEVGARLALAARGMVYGQHVTYKSPAFQSMKIDGGRAIATFSDAKGGLEVRGGSVSGFTIAGTDQKFHNAEADVNGSTVTVWSPAVPNPTAVRYGWANYPLTNLFNKAGLPASPFRTDDFPLVKCVKCRSWLGQGCTNGICNDCGGTCEEYTIK